MSNLKKAVGVMEKKRALYWCALSMITGFSLLMVALIAKNSFLDDSTKTNLQTSSSTSNVGQIYTPLRRYTFDENVLLKVMDEAVALQQKAQDSVVDQKKVKALVEDLLNQKRLLHCQMRQAKRKYSQDVPQKRWDLLLQYRYSIDFNILGLQSLINQKLPLRDPDLEPRDILSEFFGSIINWAWNNLL